MEGKDKKRNQRKTLNLAVKREFQMWLLVRIVGVVFVSSLVAVLVLYLYSRQEISSSFYSAHIQIRRVSDLMLLSGVALALFLPQKLAGPIYRVQKNLEVIREGDLTEHVVLRRNDPLTDLAASMNEATAGLRTRIQEIKEIQQALDQIIASLKHQEATEVSARQNAALDRLRTQK